MSRDSCDFNLYWSPFDGSTTTTRHKFLGSNNY